MFVLLFAHQASSELETRYLYLGSSTLCVETPTNLGFLKAPLDTTNLPTSGVQCATSIPELDPEEMDDLFDPGNVNLIITPLVHGTYNYSENLEDFNTITVQNYKKGHDPAIPLEITTEESSGPELKHVIVPKDTSFTCTFVGIGNFIESLEMYDSSTVVFDNPGIIGKTTIYLSTNYELTSEKYAPIYKSQEFVIIGEQKVDLTLKNTLSLNSFVIDNVNLKIQDNDQTMSSFTYNLETTSIDIQSSKKLKTTNLNLLIPSTTTFTPLFNLEITNKITFTSTTAESIPTVTLNRQLSGEIEIQGVYLTGDAVYHPNDEIIIADIAPDMKIFADTDRFTVPLTYIIASNDKNSTFYLLQEINGSVTTEFEASPKVDFVVKDGVINKNINVGKGYNFGVANLNGVTVDCQGYTCTAAVINGGTIKDNTGEITARTTIDINEEGDYQVIANLDTVTLGMLPYFTFENDIKFLPKPNTLLTQYIIELENQDFFAKSITVGQGVTVKFNSNAYVKGEPILLGQSTSKIISSSQESFLVVCNEKAMTITQLMSDDADSVSTTIDVETTGLTRTDHLIINDIRPAPGRTDPMEGSINLLNMKKESFVIDALDIGENFTIYIEGYFTFPFGCNAASRDGFQLPKGEILLADQKESPETLEAPTCFNVKNSSVQAFITDTQFKQTVETIKCGTYKTLILSGGHSFKLVPDGDNKVLKVEVLQIYDCLFYTNDECTIDAKVLLINSAQNSRFPRARVTEKFYTTPDVIKDPVLKNILQEGVVFDKFFVSSGQNPNVVLDDDVITVDGTVINFTLARRIVLYIKAAGEGNTLTITKGAELDAYKAFDVNLFSDENLESASLTYHFDGFVLDEIIFGSKLGIAFDKTIGTKKVFFQGDGEATETVPTNVVIQNNAIDEFLKATSVTHSPPEDDTWIIIVVVVVVVVVVAIIIVIITYFFVCKKRKISNFEDEDEGEEEVKADDIPLQEP